MRRWLVDTQLIADWCLWQLADEPHQKRRIERAAVLTSVLASRVARDALNRALEKSTVLLSTNVVVETTGVLWRRLQNDHRGDEDDDRLNEKFLRSNLKFADRFKVELIDVSEQDADNELKEMNRSNPPKPFDLGDAALLAAHNETADRSLLTSDQRLFTYCVNAGRKNVFRFNQGDIFDSKGNLHREEYAKPSK